MTDAITRKNAHEVAALDRLEAEQQEVSDLLMGADEVQREPEELDALKARFDTLGTAWRRLFRRYAGDPDD